MAHALGLGPGAGLAQALAQGLGHGDAGHLVVHELGVAVGLERQDAEQYGDLDRAEALEELVPYLHLVERLGHREVGPGVDLLAEARDLEVEVVDINDGSLGRVRMAVLATALVVREATGLDISMHFTCRDRNLIGIQGDLLGAHALGIRNILAMTGDPPRGGDYVNATAVFDVDAIGLARIVAGMNRGVDAAGNSIGEPTAFGIGVAVDPGAADPSREIDRLHAKIEAGAMWAQTQPVYDLEQLDGFLTRTASHSGGCQTPATRSRSRAISGTRPGRG